MINLDIHLKQWIEEQKKEIVDEMYKNIDKRLTGTTLAIAKGKKLIIEDLLAVIDSYNREQKSKGS